MTDPGFIFGQVPTAAQWNAAFSTKQDILGFTPVNRAGDSMTGKLVTTASIAGGAGLSVLPGVAPSAPINGDIWVSSTGMFAQLNGSSVQLAAGSGVVNSGTANQLAYYATSGAAISGNPNLTVFNGALTLGSPASIAGTIILSGSVSGGVTLAGASAGGSGTITFPAGTIDFSATGGTSQVVKQTSAGGPFTVARLAVTDLSTSTTGAGSIVLANTPTLITPVLGAATHTSLTGPLVVGGTGPASTLALQSTSGTGAGDSVVITGGLNGATTIATFAGSTGIVTINTPALSNGSILCNGARAQLEVNSNLGGLNSTTIQVNIANTNSLGMILGFDGSGVSTSNYHGALTGWIVNVQNAPINFGTNNALRMALGANGGLVVGTGVTGGDRGVGTINVAANIFLNNTAYTNPDFVFEKYYTGKIDKFANNPGAKDYVGLMSLLALRQYTQDNLRLPGIDDNPAGVVERFDTVLTKLEEMTLYILELNDRIDDLELGSM